MCRFDEDGTEDKEVGSRMNGDGIKKPSRDTLKLILLISVIYLVMESVGVTCPIKFITGISCAGCGMSRAWFAVLNLDLKAAFKFHPLFFLPPVVIILFFLRSKINRKVFLCVMYAVGAIFLFVYLYRMFFLEGDIVVFEPEKGFFVRLLKKVLFGV